MARGPLRASFRMTSRITELERSTQFVDQQVGGSFHRFRHEQRGRPRGNPATTTASPDRRVKTSNTTFIAREPLSNLGSRPMFAAGYDVMYEILVCGRPYQCLRRRRRLGPRAVYSARRDPGQVARHQHLEVRCAPLTRASQCTARIGCRFAPRTKASTMVSMRRRPADDPPGRVRSSLSSRSQETQRLPRGCARRRSVIPPIRGPRP